MTFTRHLIAFSFVFLTASATAQTFRLSGFVSARGVYTQGRHRSWLDGGFARFGTSPRVQNVDVVQLGADWTPASWIDVHVGVQGRAEQARASVRPAGLVDAFVAVRKGPFQLRAGQFFLGTSRENRGNLWTSPYTINDSALNTWIGEEVRPVGAELEWRHEMASFDAVTIAGGAFRNNDTMGTLLGWRGWSIGNRVSVYGEVLPLPPLFSLHDERFFEDQRHDGTRPFESDLDGRTGYTLRARFQRPERGSFQVARIDNRGDREEYRNEYAWQTHFYVVSADIRNDRGTSFLAEYCWGVTGMGFRPEAVVDLSYYAAYALASQTFGRNRLSARFDVFQTADRDHTAAETNSETGRAWTLAWFYELPRSTRLGLEFANVSSRRPAAAESGFDPVTDGRSVTLELRYGF
jgi:hypothetical protein